MKEKWRGGIFCDRWGVFPLIRQARLPKPRGAKLIFFVVGDMEKVFEEVVAQTEFLKVKRIKNQRIKELSI
ncbi:MAG: hypothetical protein HY764_01160 [Candidatus Portnoybacteria bacterium]|nr:hypothetical protein [Candidatus Portnoybacteria bacterium]